MGIEALKTVVLGWSKGYLSFPDKLACTFSSSISWLCYRINSRNDVLKVVVGSKTFWVVGFKTIVGV